MAETDNSRQLGDIKSMQELEKIRRLGGLHGYEATNFDSFFGLSINGNQGPIAKNQDANAFVFFTRPSLNLFRSNIIGQRKLHYLLDEDPVSVGCYIRNMLCPLGLFGNVEAGFTKSKLIDDTNPFIPVLTNSLKSLTGWRDRAVDFFVSQEGIRKQVTIMPDSVPHDFGRNDLTAGFINLEGGVVDSMINTWCYYMQCISTGDMKMHPKNVGLRRMDSQTRAYVLVTDPSKTWLQKIACTGYGYWGASMEGAPFNYNRESFFNEDSDELSVPLVCAGARYNDPIIVRDFNRVVLRMNGTTYENFISDRVKLKPFEKLAYDNRALPYIAESGEIEWWIKKDMYNQLKEYYGS